MPADARLPVCLADYERLMAESFREMYRVLKPGRWASVVFHNSDDRVWQAIQRGATAAGFELGSAVQFDKVQLTFKGLKGEKGELVFTAIQREAMPLIRYRTRDVTTLRREKCTCGRTLLKMDKIYGRSDDMLIIGGVNVFPSQIESLLLDVEEIEPQYVIIVRKKGYLDQLHVDVEAKKETFDLGAQKIAEVEKKIETRIRGMIGIGIKIRLVPPKSITRSEGKAKRVFDERKM